MIGRQWLKQYGELEPATTVNSMLRQQVLLTDIDDRRQEANAKLDRESKTTLGQYMTSAPVAKFMASLFEARDLSTVHVLDAGAGIGSLTAAFVQELFTRPGQTQQVSATAYEIDPIMAAYLRQTLDDCGQLTKEHGVAFTGEVIERDFIEDGSNQLFMGGTPAHAFTHAILNPPYKKIHTDSEHRRLLRLIGVETVNLYTGFLAIAVKMLAPGGQMVAIVPRSFCNGPYYRPFRERFLGEMTLRHIHIFESRTDAFKDDEVLQENIIFWAVKGQDHGQVKLSTSTGSDFEHSQWRFVDYADIVRPDDPELFIHLGVYEDDQLYVERMQSLPCTLKDLGIEVSTGPVVDFRLAEYLRNDPSPTTLPLIYPVHCRDRFVSWPLPGSKKPNAIENAEPVLKWLYENGHYCVVRRFSSKEETRRVVASVHDPHDVPGTQIGFENHLNVFHCKRKGLSPELARGLAVYLNSTLFDVCFRQFNGHTQVNVKDLYNLRYPERVTLEEWGRQVEGHSFPSQETIDSWIERDLF
jgi:adenine-specific DNA-methyltransferase